MDELLTKGMLIFGVASDDAHVFKKIQDNTESPGRGHVVVRAPSLDADAITNAMQTGDFYASNGVFLKKYEITDDNYNVEVDEEKQKRFYLGEVSQVIQNA